MSVEGTNAILFLVKIYAGQAYLFKVGISPKALSRRRACSSASVKPSFDNPSAVAESGTSGKSLPNMMLVGGIILVSAAIAGALAEFAISKYCRFNSVSTPSGTLAARCGAEPSWAIRPARTGIPPPACEKMNRMSGYRLNEPEYMRLVIARLVSWMNSVKKGGTCGISLVQQPGVAGWT